MKGTLTPRIKVCYISSIEEAQMAMEAGADALGLVGPMPSGPGIICNALIKEIAAKIPPPVTPFLLTSETHVSRIAEHQQQVHINTIQMVDAVDVDQYDEIRAVLPGIKLVQVIHVTNEKSIEDAIRVSKQVDALLLDSGNPNRTIKELGGTGRVHNWEWSKTIREEISIPLFLAGGLNAQNIQEAIACVQPFGVDLCSGVRTDGHLDGSKLKPFFAAIHDT